MDWFALQKPWDGLAYITKKWVRKMDKKSLVIGAALSAGACTAAYIAAPYLLETLTAGGFILAVNSPVTIPVAGVALVIPSVSAGALKGYATTKDASWDNVIDKTLTYGPTVMQAALGGLAGGSMQLADCASHRSVQGPLDAAVVFGVGAVLGGAVGAGLGALETLIGYGAGYGVGKVLYTKQ